MAKYIRIPVKPNIWHWALEESQKDKAEFFDRFPAAKKWLNQELNPTFNQLEDVANFFRVPFGYMLLDSPPQKNIVEVEFRSISNKIPQISKNLQDTILEMDSKRSWMNNYRREHGWTKLDVISGFAKHKIDETATDAKVARTLLGLPNDWHTQVGDLDQAFKYLKDKLEEAGILVMRNGIVGSNTHRPLDINEFRAFMLYDELAPLIFVNNNDSKAGKIFSLIHEYFHILFEQEDILLDFYVENAPLEKRINALTAEFLMPQEQLLNHWNDGIDAYEQIRLLSSFFKVSKLALAIKLNSLDLVTKEVVEKVRMDSIEDFEIKRRRGSGGDFYPTYFSRISTIFAETVIRSAESGELGYTDAFRLLGVKGKTYDNIKAELMPYG